MKLALLASAGTAALIVIAAAGYLVGESSAPTTSEVQDAEEAAYDQAFEESEERAAANAEQVGLEKGDREGRQAGSADGASAADAELAAQSAASTLPGTLDEFGIPRPAPGVSPEYDNCIAQGGTPSPDGCLP